MLYSSRIYFCVVIGCCFYFNMIFSNLMLQRSSGLDVFGTPVQPTLAQSGGHANVLAVSRRRPPRAAGRHGATPPTAAPAATATAGPEQRWQRQQFRIYVGRGSRSPSPIPSAQQRCGRGRCFVVRRRRRWWTHAHRWRW